MRFVALVVAIVLTRLLLAATGGTGAFTAPTGPFVMLYNGQNTTDPYKIGAATSTDGLTWTKDAGNPVLTVGAGGTWDDAGVKDPFLVWDGSQLVTYYSGFDGTTFKIGRATATSVAGPWTKYASNPVLSVGSSGAFDEQHVSYPVVLYEPDDTGKEWKLWYSGIKVSDGIVRIGYAHSSDGLSWTKVGQVLNVGGSGAWDELTVGPATIHKSGLTYYLYYHGWSAASKRAGLVTFTDPEGTYTRHASNPLFNNTAISKTLTADTNSGSAIVTLNNTTSLNVGEQVILADGNSVIENHVIESVDSGTQVTLEDTVTSTFAVGNGAVLRSFAFFGIGVRSLQRIGGQWVMYGSPFQPADDLTVSGSTLREGNIRLTASALTGPWAYEYPSEIFALYPRNTTSWDSVSSENLSVIVAP